MNPNTWAEEGVDGLYLCVSDHNTCCISTFIVDTVHLNMCILTEQCIIRHTD